MGTSGFWDMTLTAPKLTAEQRGKLLAAQTRALRRKRKEARKMKGHDFDGR